MPLLTKEIGRFVDDVQLCFVATVNSDGSPNLSPKGSLTVYDAEHLIFANMASPTTAENLRRDPRIEINVVDVFRRRGFRFSGTAQLMPEGTAEYAFVAEPLWAQHGTAYPVFDAVKIRVSDVREVRSPAYAFGEGVTEEGLQTAFLELYAKRAAAGTGDG